MPTYATCDGLRRLPPRRDVCDCRFRDDSRDHRCGPLRAGRGRSGDLADTRLAGGSLAPLGDLRRGEARRTRRAGAEQHHASPRWAGAHRHDCDQRLPGQRDTANRGRDAAGRSQEPAASPPARTARRAVRQGGRSAGCEHSGHQPPGDRRADGRAVLLDAARRRLDDVQAGTSRRRRDLRDEQLPTAKGAAAAWLQGRVSNTA